MVTMQNKLWVFGGIRRPMDVFSDRLYTLELDPTTSPSEVVDCVWTNTNPTGERPSPRSCGSLTPLPDDKTLLLVAGCAWDAAQIITPLNDVFTYDSITNKWTKQIPDADDPSEVLTPRWGHTAQLVGGTQLYIFGSLFPSLSPPPTTHTKVISRLLSLVLHAGGQDLARKKWFNDFYILDVSL